MAKIYNKHSMRLRELARWYGIISPVGMVLSDAADEIDRLAAELFSYKTAGNLPEKDQES
jgi:hypothetical protein